METSTTEQVEETVKEAEASLNSKEYDRQHLFQQLQQLKGKLRIDIFAPEIRKTEIHIFSIVAWLKGCLFKSQEKLSALKLQESNLVAEVIGAKATAKTTGGRLHLVSS